MQGLRSLRGLYEFNSMVRVYNYYINTPEPGLIGASYEARFIM